MAVDFGLEVLMGYEQARAFLDPILTEAESSYARWDPERHIWETTNPQSTT